MGRAERLIRTGDDPVLKQVCDPVAPGEPLTFLEDMALVCRKFHGAGLAAPQIGVAKRVIYLSSHSGGPATFMINPRIVWQSVESTEGQEGCLSFPGVVALVERFDEIGVEYEDVRRATYRVTVTGFRARVIQHEIDHLDGICRVGDAAREQEQHAQAAVQRQAARRPDHCCRADGARDAAVIEESRATIRPRFRGLGSVNATRRGP